MKTRLIFVLVMVTIMLISCTTDRYIYSASPANNPYFAKKGDSKLTGYYSSDANSDPPKEYARGFDMQAGYAFGNHWALIAGYFNRKERDIDVEGSPVNSFINYKRNLVDIGGGYFTTFTKNKKFSFNFYGGIASGKFSFNEGNNLRYHESTIHKWFLQPSMNFMPGDNIRVSFAPRISFVHYGKIKTSYTSEELRYYGLDKIADKTICFFEPTINLQFGIRQIPWIKIDYAISGSSKYHPVDSYLDVRATNVSLGLSFDFSKINKDQKANR